MALLAKFPKPSLAVIHAETAPMCSMSAREAHGCFAEIVSEAAFGATRTLLLKHKKPVAAVVPIAHLEPLPALEDPIDVHEAKTAIDDARAMGTKQLHHLMAELEDQPGP